MEMPTKFLCLTVMLSLTALCMATEDQPEAAMLRQFGPYGRSPEVQRNSRNDHHDNGNRRRQSNDHQLDDFYANHNFDNSGYDEFDDYANDGYSNGDNYLRNDGGPTGGSYRPQDNSFRSGGSFNRASKPGLDRRAGYTDLIDRSGGSSSSNGSIDVYSILALGLFAAFLGYIVYYYISVNGGGRSYEGLGGEGMTKVLRDVMVAVERWALLEFLPDDLDGFDISGLLNR
ncbi:uncharacterized protein LOC122249233 isoform X2 [Penaeus japonicus]|uniref:uncharacterized protein LOC122249233 isoform X2 n=1 Tax=Penaeus japonicus TaxID=27405 RepID=UPI001C716AD0|nr:uncharacterized protein LOC122249233 isoform X2 [Penaeus japonicus]